MELVLHVRSWCLGWRMVNMAHRASKSSKTTVRVSVQANSQESYAVLCVRLRKECQPHTATQKCNTCCKWSKGACSPSLTHTKKESSQLYNSTNKACKCNQKWMTEYQGLKAKQNCFAVTFWVPRKVNYKLICVFTSFKYPIIVLKGLQKLVDRAQLTAFTHSQSNLQCRNHCLGSN